MFFSLLAGVPWDITEGTSLLRDALDWLEEKHVFT